MVEEYVGCPNCKHETVEYGVIHKGFFAGTDMYGWQFVDENAYDINYCPYCGLHLPTGEELEALSYHG